jgi:hypothetical protein
LYVTRIEDKIKNSHSILYVEGLTRCQLTSNHEELLYNILIEFGIPMKLVRLIKMCLNKTYNKDRIGKHLSDSFPFQNGLKQGDALSPLLFNFALEYAVRSPGKPGGTETKWDTSASGLR